MLIPPVIFLWCWCLCYLWLYKIKHALVFFFFCHHPISTHRLTKTFFSFHVQLFRFCYSRKTNLGRPQGRWFWTQNFASLFLSPLLLPETSVLRIADGLWRGSSSLSVSSWRQVSAVIMNGPHLKHLYGTWCFTGPSFKNTLGTTYRHDLRSFQENILDVSVRFWFPTNLSGTNYFYTQYVY